MLSDELRRFRTWIILSIMALLLLAVGANGALAGAPAALPQTNVSSGVTNSSPAPGANTALIRKGTAYGVDCSQLKQLAIDRMMNMRAGDIMAACGYTPGGSTSNPPAAPAKKLQISPSAYGGVDVDTILPDGTSPHLTQSESFVWGNATTIVVNYNDSRTAPSCYSGIAWSTDSGTTWHPSQTLCTSTHGTNEGDPIVVYNARLGLWFAGDLAVGGNCGSGSTGGIGLWTSPNGQTWSAGACAHVGTSDDRESMWVDNNPASLLYGRMYVTWNDFAVGGGRLFATHSDDGTTWSLPTALDTSGVFIRDGQVTGSPNGDGTVFVSGHTESTTDITYMFRSTDGGTTWTRFTVNTYSPAGSTTVSGCSFRAIAPIWRAPEWGQPAVSGQIGGQNVVSYVYASVGSGGDLGDVQYVRSTDNGATWSLPFRLNTDPGTQPQWQPSISATANGAIFAAWYDRRNTSDGTNYEYFGRISYDNGATWQNDQAVSDVLIPQPAQPDPNVQACYAGDYNYHSTFGNTAFLTWDDGRNNVGGTNTQDVEFDKVSLIQTPTPTGTPPTATRTWTPTNTPTSTFTPTATPTISLCGPNSNYQTTTTTGALIAGTTDTGNHTDDGLTTIALPFPITLYGQSFSSAQVSSNGQMDFVTGDSGFSNVCLPDTAANTAIFPHWDDQRTDQIGSCTSYGGVGCGIFTGVTGSAPNRTYVVEWRTVYFSNNAQLAHYEIVFNENQPGNFSVIYAQVDQGGSSATAGVQNGTGPGGYFTQFECNTAGSLTNGMQVNYVQPPCVFTSTPTRTNTPTFTPTVTITPTRTSTPTATPAGVLIGHVTWQGISQPNANNVGITATLSLCVSGAPQTYPVATDASGFFTVTTNLGPGNYNWALKAPINLGTAGTLTLLSGPTQVEMGTQRAGDCNNNNAVTTVDFNMLKNTFGKSSGQSGYDSRADFNRDTTVNIADFNLLKGNFGQAGLTLTCP